MWVRLFALLICSTCSSHIAAQDDGYALLENRYAPLQAMCSPQRSGVQPELQPSGNLSFPACKSKCDSLRTGCGGISFKRGGMFQTGGMNGAPTTCQLLQKCQGRIEKGNWCGPEVPEPSVASRQEKARGRRRALANATDNGACRRRPSNIFNYMRVIPFEPSSVNSTDDASSDDVVVRTHNTALPDWTTAFKRLPSRAARVGLLYLNLGTWPPWTRFILRAASANAGVDFYFVGDRLDTSQCANCYSLPFDLASLRQRIRRHILDDPSVDTFGAGSLMARKLCDLVPMWPALFPELSARHTFIGITEHDMLPGNISAELSRLRDEDDMMLPLGRFPSPLTDANFMIYRSIPKMLQAFRRVPDWEKVVTSSRHFRFDEWVVEPPSVMVAFQEMLLASEIRVVPAQQFLVQDVVVIRGRSFPTIDSYGARVVFRWRGGSLLLERDGPCVCPNDIVPVFGVTSCALCLLNPGAILRTRTLRKLEVMGFHFSAWKKRWRPPSYDGVSPLPAVPTCAPDADFDLSNQGFQCGNRTG